MALAERYGTLHFVMLCYIILEIGLTANKQLTL